MYHTKNNTNVSYVRIGTSTVSRPVERPENYDCVVKQQGSLLTDSRHLKPLSNPYPLRNPVSDGAAVAVAAAGAHRYAVFLEVVPQHPFRVDLALGLVTTSLQQGRYSVHDHLLRT